MSVTAHPSMAAVQMLMAADRTLMSWIRTSQSMMGFGFTIYKILQGFQSSGAVLRNDVTPRNVGLFLTGMGTAAMLLGTMDYWQAIKHQQAYEPVKMWRPALFMALLMCLFGIALFAGIVSRVV